MINSQKYAIYNKLISVYYAFFHSIASYGIIAWGDAYGNSIDLLHKLQSKIVKIIINHYEYKNNKLKKNNCKRVLLT